MRQFSYPPIVIFSAQLASNSEVDNVGRDCQCQQELTRLAVPFKRVQGCYKGTKEDSFLVSADYLETVKTLAFDTFKQESILSIDAFRVASLVYADGRSEPIGHFERVTDVTGRDAYTTDLETGEHYACV